MITALEARRKSDAVLDGRYQADLDDEAFNRMLTTAIGNIPRCIYEDVEVR